VEYEFVVCMFVVVEVAWGRNGGTGMVVVDSMADRVVGNRRRLAVVGRATVGWVGSWNVGLWVDLWIGVLSVVWV
jgi:hypothetical protein